MHPVAAYILFFVAALLPFWLASKRKCELIADSDYKDPGSDNINSLRGIAAILVALHHAVFAWNYYHNGHWSLVEGNNFFSQGMNYPLITLASFGYIPVMLFFMITGFLFANHSIKNNGIDIPSFYYKRFCRLVPQYLFVTVIVLFVTYAMGTKPATTFIDIFRFILSWLTFGFVEPVSFSPNYRGSLIVAGVIWTLAYEWMFYLLFPSIVAFIFLFRNKVLCMAVAIAIIVLFCKTGIVNEKNATLTLCFAFGILAALVHEYYPALKRIFISKAFMMFSIAALVIMVLGLKYKAYSLYASPLLFPLFISVASGASLLGLLKITPVRLAGTASYSLYLLHGVIYASVFTWTNLAFIPGVTLSLLIISTISILTYTWIERPFIKKGKKAFYGYTPAKSGE